MSGGWSMIEELMARQVVRPVVARRDKPTIPQPPAPKRGLPTFRAGMRVIAVEGGRGDRQIDRWQDHPAGVTIDA